VQFVESSEVIFTLVHTMTRLTSKFGLGVGQGVDCLARRRLVIFGLVSKRSLPYLLDSFISGSCHVCLLSACKHVWSCFGVV